MTNKYLEIIKSPRWQQALLIAVIQILVVLNVVDSAQGVQIANILSVFLGVSVGISTIDKNVGQAKVLAAKELGGSTTVTIPDTVSAVTAKTTTSKKK